jgi:hypothetical protein
MSVRKQVYLAPTNAVLSFPLTCNNKRRVILETMWGSRLVINWPGEGFFLQKALAGAESFRKTNTFLLIFYIFWDIRVELAVFTAHYLTVLGFMQSGQFTFGTLEHLINFARHKKTKAVFRYIWLEEEVVNLFSTLAPHQTLRG